MSHSLERISFMAPIRAALGRRESVQPDPPPQVDPGIVRRVSRAEALPRLFASNARAVGMSVQFSNSSSLPSTLAQLLADRNVRRVSLGTVPADVAPALSARGLILVDGSSFPPLFDADASITDAHAAIAETGSLLCHAGPAHARGHSLVPPIHIALVRASRVLPDLLDALPADAAPPPSVLLITGPSKTADIEGILITGVHGPREVCVVVIEDQ